MRIYGWVEASTALIWETGIVGTWSGTGEGRGYFSMAKASARREPSIVETASSRYTAGANLFAVTRVGAVKSAPVRKGQSPALTVYHEIAAPMLASPGSPSRKPESRTTAAMKLLVPVATSVGKPIMDFGMAIDETDIDRLAFILGLACQSIDKPGGILHLQRSAGPLVPGGETARSLVELLGSFLLVVEASLPPELAQEWDELSETLRLSDARQVDALRRKMCASFEGLEGIRLQGGNDKARGTQIGTLEGVSL